MADESLLERLTQLKRMVDKALADSPIGDDASSLALLDAYSRIRAEVAEFVYSLGAKSWDLTDENYGRDSPTEASFGWAFPYLPGRKRDPSEAESNLRRLGDWLQHLIDVETLAQQWGGTKKAYRAARLQLDRTSQ